jgi:4-hydroxythreonine-4-phosphate dehydrogenase
MTRNKQNETMEKVKIGITIGDVNGIGPEVIIKTLINPKLLDFCTPVIYGSAKVMSYHRNVAKSDQFIFKSITDLSRPYTDKINVVNCWNENVMINLGKVTEDGGKFAHIALDRAVQDLKAGHLDALLTGPINKKAMNLVGFPYKGHTDYLADQFNNPDHLMLLADDSLRVAVLTHHIPVREIADAITKEKIARALEVLQKMLIQDLDIEKPHIGILGLNPHASDEGVMGDEEENIIRPAIIEAKKSGLLVSGPYSPDGFWGARKYKNFDAILCMYHDQGLIPFKMHSFGRGVNVTAGLPFVRTSPDHGTAFDIAGKNEADPESFRAALYQAIDMAKNRKNYFEMRKNSVEKTAKPSEEVVE